MLNNNKFILNSILAFSMLSLAIAYYIQYGLGHKPCNLCLIERIPYIAALILISLIFILDKFERLILGVLMLFFILGAIVSFYHVGIEQGFFSESLLCELGLNTNIQNTNDLLKSLEKTPISCKDVTFRIFGLSLATFNAFLSIVISYILLKLIMKNE